MLCFATLLIVSLRVRALKGAIPTGFEEDLEATFIKSYTLDYKLWTILWIVCLAGSFALWIAVACFLVLYNLITIQIVWLLAIIFGSGGH